MNTATTPDKADPRGWLPGFLLLGVIWGSSFLFIKVGVAELHPLYVTLGRVLAGVLTLLVVIAATRDRLPRDLRLWGHLTVTGVVGTAMPFTLFGYGEERVSSSLAGIWNATTALLVLPLAVYLFRTERMTVNRAVGLVIGFLGVLVVLGVWEGLGGAQFTGQLMCIAAAACYAVAIPYTKRFISDSGESGLALAAGQLITATVALAIVAPLTVGAPTPLGDLSGKAIASILALGAVGTGLAFVLNMRNIQIVGATTASMVTYLIPIFAVVLGVLALDEHITWHQPVGALIVLVGVAVAQGLIASRKRPRPAAVAPEAELAAERA
ncbi:transporter [Asanoa ishikariensis]|uniref:Permease of the drug/metabolite transporter (DMT) superfamily n=1 Tax=Asanoa ishikariensis TaxID=137265 RepID=A0A1H3UXC2_9ACTN|nr:DMT family transporter [Asanoa ishikariensis]GIF65208.1 transporter [Asanoa ishikariensis]SDZ66631.1 Permease of the drug/metabolite transporter (DMT) superfamily [Asanoa ishikariensis]